MKTIKKQNSQLTAIQAALPCGAMIVWNSGADCQKWRKLLIRQTTQITPITTLYARLSKDDELQGESNSISNHEKSEFEILSFLQ
ncbi:MAG: hypothetical protein ACLT3H_11685 [Roseburia sp.]